MEWAGGLRKQRSVWQGQAAAGGEDALWLEASPSPHALLISLTPAGEAFAGRWQEGSFVTFGSPILSGPALLLALSGGSQRLWPSPSCPAVGLRVRRPYIKARCQGNNGWNGYVKPWSPGEGESCRRQSSTQSRPPMHMGERESESDPPPTVWSPLHATGHMQLAVLHLTLVQWGADSQMSVLCHPNSKTDL